MGDERLTDGRRLVGSGRSVGAPQGRDARSIDRRQSLLDRHRMHEDECMLWGFVNLFWITMAYFALLVIVRNVQNGEIITFKILSLAFGQGFCQLALEVLLVFALSLMSFPLLLLGPYVLPAVHSAYLKLALQRSQGWPPIWIMIYLMSVLVMLMKMHSFAVDRSSRCRLRDYALHLVSPEIVYLHVVPRTARVSWRGFWEKVTGIMVAWFFAHLVVENHLLPCLLQVKAAPIDQLLNIAVAIFLPTLLTYLLLFLLFFEFFLGALAELLRWEDRRFFGDWWNSTSFADFARKWNMPVHKFIRGHVYHPLRRRLSPGNANAASFLISSLLHELVMWAALGRRSMFIGHFPFLFCFQMAQMPLMAVGKRLGACSPFLANLFFWFDMVFGPPVITILYIRY